MKKIPIILIFLNVFTGYINAQEKIIDQVVAIVGDNIITMSDVENQYLQYLAQGYTQKKQVKCQVLEEMLYQKLLLNQAKLDSVEVTDSQIESELDRRIRYFTSQLGSQENLEKYYNKSILELKSEFRTLIRDMIMTQTMESQITKDIKVTPSEVKEYFKKIPKDSLPLINSELEIGQIIKQPPVNEKEKIAVKEKLNALRQRVLKGEDFKTLAILYSEDPGSASDGGELGLHGRGEMYTEFEAVAFTLKKDSVSPIIESEAGYHIIQLIERKGEYVNVRHILLQPKVSIEDLAKAKLFLDSVANLINTKAMTFEEAALKFSDDPSKKNDGLMINTYTGTTKFETEQLDPAVFFTVDKLKVGQISYPVIMKQSDGKQAYRILYLKSRTNPHRANLKDDYDKIQSATLSEKQNNAISDWVDDKIKNTYISINEEFKDCEFSHNWINK